MNTSATISKVELVPGKYVSYFYAFLKLAMFKGTNFSQTIKPSCQLGYTYKHQKVSGRSIFSWLLVLIMISGPFQASIAMHPNLNTQDGGNQVLVAQCQETTVDDGELHCTVGHCQSLSSCATHFSCTPISLTSSPQISLQAQFYHHDPVADVAVSTRFPDPLKRPPRS